MQISRKLAIESSTELRQSFFSSLKVPSVISRRYLGNSFFYLKLSFREAALFPDPVSIIRQQTPEDLLLQWLGSSFLLLMYERNSTTRLIPILVRLLTDPCQPDRHKYEQNDNRIGYNNFRLINPIRINNSGQPTIQPTSQIHPDRWKLILSWLITQLFS